MYDLVVRNAKHEVVYQWSEGKAFLPVIAEDELLIGERAFQIDAEIPAAVPDGEYQVEVWLVTTLGPQFAASAGIKVQAQ